VQFLTSRAGSAGGPKPGRASFYGELGGAFNRILPTITEAGNTEILRALFVYY